jgi:hypothetical protein
LKQEVEECKRTKKEYESAVQAINDAADLSRRKNRLGKLKADGIDRTRRAMETDARRERSDFDARKGAGSAAA